MICETKWKGGFSIDYAQYVWCFSNFKQVKIQNNGTYSDPNHEKGQSIN